MSEAANSALTPEQWEAHFTFPEGGYFSDQMVRLGKGEDSVGVPLLLWDEIAVTYDSAVCAVRIPASERHATAALALHGQPFGFTRKHWAAIVDLVGLQDPDGTEDLLNTCREAAARIEALLPPEGK